MIIKKKCWPEYFQQILDGHKTFEIRLADFECNAGDILLLEEYDPKTQRYTGRTLSRKITYIVKTKDFDFWIASDIEMYGFQIMSLGDEEQ